MVKQKFSVASFISDLGQAREISTINFRNETEPAVLKLFERTMKPFEQKFRLGYKSTRHYFLVSIIFLRKTLDAKINLKGLLAAKKCYFAPYVFSDPLIKRFKNCLDQVLKS